jgi:lysyl-tRNA synthetase class 2
MNQKIREFFQSEGFTEVETPNLVSQLGSEPHIDLFQSQFYEEGNPNRCCELYLIPSPEFAMKKILASGLAPIFQISKVWRNGEYWSNSPRHNPEFTLLEWYRRGEGAEKIMQDMENLIPYLAKNFHESCHSEWGEKTFIWKPPFQRISIPQAFEQFAGIQLSTKWDPNTLEKQAKEIGLNFSQQDEWKTKKFPEMQWERIFWQIFFERIEKHLPPDRPYFLVDFPVPLASYAKLKEPHFDRADRFELFLGNVEVANGFSEIMDPQDQKERFYRDNQIRAALGKKTNPVDMEYIDYLSYGIQPAAGVALGLDRLLMVLCNEPDIRNVLAFPFSPGFSSRQKP